MMSRSWYEAPDKPVSANYKVGDFVLVEPRRDCRGQQEEYWRVAKALSPAWEVESGQFFEEVLMMEPVTAYPPVRQYHFPELNVPYEFSRVYTICGLKIVCRVPMTWVAPCEGSPGPGYWIIPKRYKNELATIMRRHSPENYWGYHDNPDDGTPSGCICHRSSSSGGSVSYNYPLGSSNININSSSEPAPQQQQQPAGSSAAAPLALALEVKSDPQSNTDPQMSSSSTQPRSIPVVDLTI